MGDFSALAETLLGSINASGRVLANDLPGLIGGTEPVNCYPGRPDGGCHQVAYFISLNGHRHGRGHLKFSAAVQKFLQHMQGRCRGTTQAAVIVTDTWEAEALSGWRLPIEQIKREAHVEAYLISGNSITQIEL